MGGIGDFSSSVTRGLDKVSGGHGSDIMTYGGYAAGGLPGLAAGYLASGGSDWQEKAGLTNNKAKEAKADFNSSLDRQNDYTKNANSQMDQYAKDYQGQRNTVLDDYQKRRDQARSEVEAQGVQADKTYSETIKPRLYGIMEDAQKNANDAMSLKDAGDVNNSIQTATRQSYENQALGEGRQGLADTGVMQALGAQAFGGQIGNGQPITGGQMTALMGANQAAAGRAFANTQQRVQNLRDQGRTAAQAASDAQYKRGLDAKDRYRGSVGDVEGAEDRYFNRSGDFRNQKLGYDTQTANIGINRANEDMGLNNNSVNRGLATEQQYEGQKRGMSAADIAAANASQAAKMGAFGSILGTGLGAYAGGAQGAAVGNQVGGKLGGAGAPQVGVPQQQYGYGQ